MSHTLNWDTDRRRHQRHRIHYQGPRDADTLKAAVTEHRRAVLVLIEEAKQSPCTDCGVRYPKCVMQFDHVDPAKKLFSVAEAVGLLPRLEMLKAEIAKCELVCANCHAIRTAKQRALGLFKKRARR
jgi:hypothetical protein